MAKVLLVRGGKGFITAVVPTAGPEAACAASATTGRRGVDEIDRRLDGREQLTTKDLVVSRADRIQERVSLVDLDAASLPASPPPHVDDEAPVTNLKDLERIHPHA